MRIVVALPKTLCLQVKEVVEEKSAKGTSGKDATAPTKVIPEPRDPVTAPPAAEMLVTREADAAAEMLVKRDTDVSETKSLETCGPTIIDENALSKIFRGNETETGGVDVRLQCWDFPGQEEYALLNQLFFSERAIYMLFFDLSGDIETEWRHIAFWMWSIARYSTDNNATPPILLVGTKAGAPQKLNESELQKRLEKLQKKVPILKEQLRPRPSTFADSACSCLLQVENKSKTHEAWIHPLRAHLQRMALQFVTPRDIWISDLQTSEGKLPAFVGLQSDPFPLAWLQAHDLLTRLGNGFRPA